MSDQFSTEGVDSSLLSQLARHSNVKYGLEPTRCIEEATTEIKTTTEGLSEAGVSRIVAKSGWSRRMPKKPKTVSNALAVARQQQAKSWKLRAATSMARLWRDQGKRQAEGFHTLDLKEGKTLLDELAG